MRLVHRLDLLVAAGHDGTGLWEVGERPGPADGLDPWPGGADEARGTGAVPDVGQAVGASRSEPQTCQRSTTRRVATRGLTRSAYGAPV